MRLRSLSKPLFILLLFGILSVILVVKADDDLIKVCPAVGIQSPAPNFQPGGIILTSFDGSSNWVYDIDARRRYPLPVTHPCTSNCQLSPDAQWLAYYNAEDDTIGKMRLDGTERSLLARNAADVEWWSDEMLLVWTTIHEAYLLPETGSIDTETLPVDGVISVQPGGRWGLLLEQQEDEFRRILVNLETRNQPDLPEERVQLSVDTGYFNGATWSPDGHWLAYVSRGALDPTVNVAGAEIFGVHPGDSLPTQWTFLTGIYGAVRLNGQALNGLSWSPDSTKIAFWVIELLGTNVESNTGHAVIHTLDVQTREITVYCGFSTNEHTPNPPHLSWSPDGTHIAFGGNITGDNKGYLLLALNVETGIFTELSDGIYPAFGSPDVIAWGERP